MNYSLAFITFFLITGTATRAQVNTDSLRKVIDSQRPYEEQIHASLTLLENFQSTQPDSVIGAADKALELARKNKDSVSVAIVKKHMGVANYREGKWEKAEKDLAESIKILESQKNAKQLAPVYNELARFLRNTGRWEDANSIFNRAESLFRKLKDTVGISMIRIESGDNLRNRETYPDAYRRVKHSLEMALTTGDSVSLSSALLGMARFNLIEQQYDTAVKNLTRALSIRKQMRDSFMIALIYAELGAASSGKKEFATAIEYLLASNRIAKRLGYAELQSVNYSELIAIAQKQLDFQRAYDFYLERSFLRDSIIDLEKTKEIEAIRAQYDTEEKNQRIKQQEVRLRLQNYIFLGIGGLALLLGLLIHSFYRRNKLRQETKMKTQLLQQQEQAVKAVIEAEENERQRIARDLHDGVGQMMSAAKMNLSAFESEMKFSSEEQKQGFERIIGLVDESCRELRTVSHVMMPNALLKNNLATAIHEFTGKLNNKNIQINVYADGLDERMDSDIETVLYRVVQECVTNTIRHANASKLDITLVRDKDGITGTIEDNGKGFDASSREQFEGIGLKNIVSRIEYLKGTVDFDSAPGRGTVIAFHVPVT